MSRAITVVGDLLLDVDLEGAVERLSPDAPVPVVDVAGVTRRAGGAGLVATLLARDGHRVTLVTALGGDERRGPPPRAARPTSSWSPATPGRPRRVKTRLRTATHPIARIDEGSGRPPIPVATDAMVAAIDAAEVVLVADYGRRLTEEPSVREALSRAARRVPVVWDPHPRGSAPVHGVAAVTPNLKEATAAADVAGTGVAAADEAALQLRETWRAAAVVVTMGEHGALLRASRSGLPFVAQGDRVDGADPCGAGDRFAASVAVAIAGGAPPTDAVTTAVAETGGVPRRGRRRRPGAGPPTPCSCRAPTATRSPSPSACAPPAAPSSRRAAASTCCTPATPARCPPRGRSATA